MAKKFDLPAESLERIRSVISFDPVTGIFTWKAKTCRKVIIGERAGSVDKSGYRIISHDGKHYFEHLVAWVWVNGAIPSGMVVDHRDGDPGNNAITNLRLLPQRLNTQNVVRKIKREGPDGKKLPQGVHWLSSKGKFVACIKINYQKKHLGTFATQQEAHQAYLAAKKNYHPESNISRLI